MAKRTAPMYISLLVVALAMAAFVSVRTATAQAGAVEAAMEGARPIFQDAERGIANLNRPAVPKAPGNDFRPSPVQEMIDRGNTGYELGSKIGAVADTISNGSLKFSLLSVFLVVLALYAV
ncbi:hypothetical protein ACP70R_030485 [Stipagrostis hirtigluma subsp. patula]